MEKERLRELNELRKYLEIPTNEFKLLLLLALTYKDENGKKIHEDDLYLVVEEALNNIDYHKEDSFEEALHTKSVQEAFNRALINLGYKKSNKKR